MVRAMPLSSSEGESYHYSIQRHSRRLCTSNLWQQFGEGLFLIQHDNVPMYKPRSIQKCFVEISMGKLDWPSQSPDLYPIENLWDEFERRLQARPNAPTLVTSLMLLWLNGSNVPTASGKPSQKSGGCYRSKGGTNSILMAMILE